MAVSLSSWPDPLVYRSYLEPHLDLAAEGWDGVQLLMQWGMVGVIGVFRYIGIQHISGHEWEMEQSRFS